MKKMLEEGTSPNTKGRYDRPVLEIAIEDKQVEASKVLIEAGADFKLIDEPITHAIQSEVPEIALLLIKKRARLEGPAKYPTLAPLASAAGHKQLAVVKALLAKKAPIETTTLESAVQGGDVEIVKLLADQVKEKDKLLTALERAMSNKSVPLIKVLLGDAVRRERVGAGLRIFRRRLHRARRRKAGRRRGVLDQRHDGRGDSPLRLADADAFCGLRLFGARAGKDVGGRRRQRQRSRQELRGGALGQQFFEVAVHRPGPSTPCIRASTSTRL